MTKMNISSNQIEHVCISCGRCCYGIAFIISAYINILIFQIISKEHMAI
uniref:Uncharacterized protein n=1 Tax=Anguilla anguilla TaxID=7936 RepID=A0A0E9Q385_ANGAN